MSIYTIDLESLGFKISKVRKIIDEQLTDETLNEYELFMLKISLLKKPEETWNQMYEKLVIEQDFSKNKEDFCKHFKIEDLDSNQEISPERYILFINEWIQNKTLTLKDSQKIQELIKNKDITILQFLYSIFPNNCITDEIRKRLLFEREEDKTVYIFENMTQELVDFLKLHPNKEKNVVFNNQEYNLVNDLFFANKNLEIIFRLQITDEIFYYLMNNNYLALTLFFIFQNEDEIFKLVSIVGKSSFPLQKSKLIEFLNNEELNPVPVFTIVPKLIENKIINIKQLKYKTIEKLIVCVDEYIYTASYLLLFKENDRINNPKPIKINKRILDDGILDDYSKEKLCLFIDDMDEYAKSVLVTDELILMSKDEKRKRLLLITNDQQEYTETFLSLYLEDKIRISELLSKKFIFNESTVTNILENFSGNKLRCLVMLEDILPISDVLLKQRFYNLGCIKLKNENYDFPYNKERIIINEEFEQKLALNGFLIELIPSRKRTLKLLKIAYRQNHETIRFSPFWLRPFV